MFSVLFVIGLVALGAYLAMRYYPTQTERLFRRFWTLRSVAFAAFWLLLGYFSIASGVLPLVLFGAAIYLVAAVYILVENPREVI